MLRLHKVTAGYGAIEVVHGVDLDVPAERIVALLGANGAGKSTTLNAVAGLIPVRSGTIEFAGERVERFRSHQLVRRGLVLVPQTRELFPDMTIRENLELGIPRGKEPATGALEWVFELFPRLRERIAQHAGTLSGGERAMLAIGRALVSRPKLLVLDEPTAGLAPLLVAQVADVLRQIKATGQTVLLVEQNVKVAMSVADTVHVVRNGRIVASRQSDDATADVDLFASFVG